MSVVWSSGEGFTCPAERTDVAQVVAHGPGTDVGAALKDRNVALDVVGR